MPYLLDTHTLVWSLTGDDKLSERARAVIANKTNPIYVSSISLYELAIKYHLGKWADAGFIVQNAMRLLEQMQYNLLPINGEHALYAAALPLNHKDPFDRLLVAQTAVDRLVFISKDKTLETFGIELLW